MEVRAGAEQMPLLPLTWNEQQEAQQQAEQPFDQARDELPQQAQVEHDDGDPGLPPEAVEPGEAFEQN